jgi:ABC-2 type transport system ATP-binding protein
MLMGLAPPTSGEIQILGLPMPAVLSTSNTYRPCARREPAVRSSDRPEYTEFVGRMYGWSVTVARERSRELMALFQLDGNERKLISEYSKGMRKRVAMAAALIHGPELFLMDEPFEGVDAVGAR